MEEKQMINKVLQYVKEQQMFEKNDYVVAGVSGGADSVCLLFMLLEIRKIIPIKLHIVHVNHLLREEAGRDAAYVEQLCREYKLPFTLVERDVGAIASNRRISTEEAGRDVRYEAFYKALGSRKGKIAIAHNKNDCCETFLFHLFRGSSLKGLAGIRPVREVIVRPLLCMERAEIEEFLRERQIKFCIDSTNLEDNYTRNRIRHHILETVESEISPAAVSHISDACERISEAYELIADLTLKEYDKCITCTTDDGERIYYLNIESFSTLHKTLQGYVIMELLSRAAGSRRDLEAVHVLQVKNLLHKQCGRQINLPYDLVAVRDYNGIYVRKNVKNPVIENKITEVVLDEQEKHRLLKGEKLKIQWENQKELEFSLIRVDNLQNIPQKKYTKWLDYDKIKDNIVVRTRKTGDYLTVNSMNQKKTLKAYLIDQKVPREVRDNICLVTDGSHVMWVVGERISSYYKVSGKTKTILQVSLTDKD